METLSLLWFWFLSLFTSTQPPQYAKWIFVDPLDGQRSKETHQLSLEEVNVPFVWVNLKHSTLDSMAAKGQEYDSLAKIGLPDHPEYVVGGVMVFLPDSMRLFYSETVAIKIDNSDYSYQIFEIYPKVELGGENIHELFYLKGLGFFAALYVDIERSKNERKHYILEDIIDKKGKSTIDRSKLKSLTDTVFLIRPQR